MEKGNLKLLVYKYTQPKMLCTEKGPTSTTQKKTDKAKRSKGNWRLVMYDRELTIFSKAIVFLFFLFSTKCIQRPVRGSIGSLQELHNTETEENSRTTGAHKPTPAWPHSYWTYRQCRQRERESYLHDPLTYHIYILEPPFPSSLSSSPSHFLYFFFFQRVKQAIQRLMALSSRNAGLIERKT